MKFKLAFLIGLINSLLFTTNLSQWVQTNGPYGGDINSFCISGKNIFAGTSDRGVYLSTDDGNTWSEVNNGLTSLSVKDLASNGANVFVGTLGGVFLTTDNGVNWISKSNGISNKQINGLAVAGDKLFAGSDSVYVTTDNGENWTLVNNGLQGTSLYCLDVTKSENGDYILFAGKAEGLFRSTDYGENWSKVNNGIIFEVSGIDSIIIAGGTARSTDYGVTWEYIPVQDLSGLVLSVTTDNSNFYAGAMGKGIFKSTDMGITWHQFVNNVKNLFIQKVISLNNNILVGTSGNLYLSTNNGENWEDVNYGIKNTRIISLSSLKDNKGNTNLFAISYLNAYRSIDLGETWTSIDQDLPFGNIHSSFASDSGTFLCTSNGLYYSTNERINWSKCTLPMTVVRQGMAIHSAANNEYIFAATDNGIYRYSNNGNKWVAKNRGTGIHVVNCITSLPGNNSNYIFINVNGVFYSTDYGENWIKANNGLENNSVSCFATFDSTIFAGTSRGVFISLDYGANWNNASSGLGDTLVQCLAVVGKNIFAGTYSKGIFLSTDFGQNWKEFDTECPDTRIGGLSIVKNNAGEVFLFVGTNSAGVWKYKLPEELTSIESNAPKLSSGFTLYQNYPNPFNPSTTINYQLPVNSKVSLKIYNSLGEEIQTLVNEYQGTGFHSSLFTIHSSFPSGIYFCRLQAGSFIATKKLCFMK